MGRKHLLKHALRSQGQTMLFADAAYLLGSPGEKDQLLWLIRRAALLNGCGVCLYGISGELLKKAALTADRPRFFDKQKHQFSLLRTGVSLSKKSGQTF